MSVHKNSQDRLSGSFMESKGAVADTDYESVPSTIRPSHSSSTPASLTPATHSTLRVLQAELAEFLATHTEKVLSLQADLPKSSLEGPSSPPLGEYTETPTEKISESNQQQLHNPTIPSQAVVYHSHHLKSFLDSHLRNIRELHDAIPQSTAIVTRPKQQENAESTPEVMDEKIYTSLTEQFNNLVVISTFTASLIVSYVSLVKSIVVDDHRLPFDVGMLFSFFAMSLHFGNIIVAGRGAALTSQRSSADEEWHDLAYFRHYLGICEQLQFFATLIFLVSIVLLTFYIFSSIAFPLTLLIVSVMISVLVFWSAYWRVSITLRNAKFIVSRVHRLRHRSRSFTT